MSARLPETVYVIVESYGPILKPCTFAYTQQQADTWIAQQHAMIQYRYKVVPCERVPAPEQVPCIVHESAPEIGVAARKSRMDYDDCGF